MRSGPGSGQLVSSDAPRVRLRPIAGQSGDRVRPTPLARGCRAGYVPPRLLGHDLLGDLIEPSLHAAAGARPIRLAHMRGRLPQLHAVGHGFVGWFLPVRVAAAAPARRLAVGRDRPLGSWSWRAARTLLAIAGGRRGRAILLACDERPALSRLIPACRPWTLRLGCPACSLVGVAVPVPGLPSVLPPAGVCVPVEPCVGGSRRDGGKCRCWTRFGVTGPLGVVPERRRSPADRRAR